MKKIKGIDLQMIINNETFNDYYSRLKLLATSIFKWENLEKHFGYGSERFLEIGLFLFGKVVAVKDPKIGLQIFNCNPTDKLNNYYLPTEINAFSINFNKNFKIEDVVIIGNNNLFTPTRNTIDLFAYRLYEIENTTNVNLLAQKTPISLECDDKTKLTIKNAYMQFTGGCPVIISNKKFDLGNKINAIKTDAPYLIDKLDNHKQSVWNECLTFLGINNNNFEKKDRLIEDEVNANNEMINYYLNLFLSERQKACDLINEKFLSGVSEDEKIKVTLNKDITDLLDLNIDDIISSDKTNTPITVEENEVKDE